MNSRIKRPRHYALEIILEPDKKARRDLLANVPAQYREWVEDLVRDHFMKAGRRASER